MLALYSSHRLPLKERSIVTSCWHDFFLKVLTGQAADTLPLSAPSLGGPLLHISHHCT